MGKDKNIFKMCKICAKVGKDDLITFIEDNDNLDYDEFFAYDKYYDEDISIVTIHNQSNNETVSFTFNENGDFLDQEAKNGY